MEQLQNAVDITIHLLRKKIQLGLAHLVYGFCDTGNQINTTARLLVLNARLRGGKIHSNRFDFSKKGAEILDIVAQLHSLQDESKLWIHFILQSKRRERHTQQSLRRLDYLSIRFRFENTTSSHPQLLPSMTLAQVLFQRQTNALSCSSRYETNVAEQVRALSSDTGAFQRYTHNLQWRQCPSEECNHRTHPPRPHTT